MQARVWGCRGSVAAPGPDTVKYGGNTSCVELCLDSGHAIVFDAGTGMRPLGVKMQDDMPREVHLFLTHLHLDHLQGLGFFRPLFRSDIDVHIWGPSSPVQHLDDADVLLHDGQYRDHEYPNHVGWGHSCTADALHFAEKSGVEKLVLFHHDPYHTDVELEKLLAEAQGQWSGREADVCLAFEGMTINVGREGVTLCG